MANVIKLIETTADGPGLRAAIYMAGCSRKCKGCHNPETWDPSAGTQTTVGEVIDRLAASEAKRVTLTGGDPLHCDNIEFTKALVKEMRDALGITDVIIYTGCEAKDLVKELGGDWMWAEKVVFKTGPFVEALACHKEHPEYWYGSSNQRWTRIGIDGETVSGVTYLSVNKGRCAR